MNNNHIYFPKKGFGFCYIFGGFIILLSIFIFSISIGKNLELKGLVSLIILLIIGLAIISFRVSAKITQHKIKTDYFVFNKIIKYKENDINTYNTIFLEKRSHSNNNDSYSSSTNTYYQITLADNKYYDLNTWVITPKISKHTYSLNMLTMFNIKKKDSFDKVIKLTNKIQKITHLNLVYSEDIEKLTSACTKD